MLPIDYFMASPGDFGTIRLLHYPGDEDNFDPAANLGISPHTDFEAFTLMHQVRSLPAQSTRFEMLRDSF